MADMRVYDNTNLKEAQGPAKCAEWDRYGNPNPATLGSDTGKICYAHLKKVTYT